MRRLGHDLKNNFAISVAKCELGLGELSKPSPDLARLEHFFNDIKNIEFLNTRIVDDKIFNSPTIRPGVFDLNGAIHQTAALLSDSMDGIEPELNLGDFPIPIEGDLMAMVRTLQNLLMNARNAINDAKRTHRGHILIETNRESDGYVNLFIKDNGCGMTMDFARDLFYRGAKEGQQHGFGFQIIRNAVESLKGHIRIESSPGAGTAFRIILPLAQHAAAMEAASPDPVGV
jgi:signal transduction histidine kinase